MTDQVAGTVLSERYALEDRIGVGGMATVYRAIDLTTGRRVAVKILSREFLARNPKEADRNVKRFRREAEILKVLSGNPYVVQVIEHDIAPSGDHFIAMELLEGEQLRFYIGRGKAAMGLRTFAYHAKHLIRGLMDIHGKNLIHRDLAPDNVVIVKTREGLPWPKFLDFGIGKSLADELDQVTQMLTIMGKPQYFSPEQARGEEFGTPSDVYSLGILLYEMLTGFVPIEVHGLSDLRRIQKEAPAPISRHPEGARVPQDLQDTIMRCLDKNPQARPTLADVLASVERFSERLDAGEEFPVASVSPGHEGGSAVGPGSDDVTHQAMPGESGGPMREFAKGDTIGRFQVRERIGRGGMGLVYLAWDPILQREVAIKVASRVEEERARRAILREARASSHLKSENIVTIYDAGTEGGAPYIAMEYVRGRTLAHMIEEDGPFTGDRFWKIARGILDGLIYAHGGEKPVIHRDLKPANILVAGDVAKIADFGIATVTAAQHLTIGGRDHSQTGGAGGEGSVLTISPEQANNKPADHRSDVYSLGCVFYMMVTGRAPFQGNQIAILYQHVTKRPEPPSKLNPGLSPSGLEAVILKCLEKDPANRYQSVQAVRADLETLFGQTQPPAPSPFRSRTLAVFAYIVVLGLAGAVAFAILLSKAGATTRVFTVAQVGGVTVRSDRPFPEAFVTRSSPLEVVLSTQEAGEVRATLAAEGAEPAVKRIALVPGRNTTLAMPLPDAGRDLSTYRLTLERLDNPTGSRTELVILRDTGPPTVEFEAYGRRHPVSPDPLRVLRLQDLSAIVTDPGGFDEDGKVTTVPVRWNENPYEIRFTRKQSEADHAWLVTVEARDRAGNPTDSDGQPVQLIRPEVVLTSPSRRPISKDMVHVELTAKLPEGSVVEGIVANDVNLGDGAFSVRLVVGSLAREPVPMTRIQGGYSAELPIPHDHSSEFEFEIEPLFDGEPLLTRRYRFDSAPPVITASCGGLTVASDRAYATTPSLAVQMLESGSEAIDCRLQDGPAGLEGATVDVQIGDGEPVRVPVDPDGTFELQLPRVSGDELVVRISASDQAGNRASTEFLAVRSGFKITSVQLGAREAVGQEAVFVQEERFPLRVTVVGAGASDKVFAKLFDILGAEQGSWTLDRIERGEVFGTREVNLFAQGETSVVRRLRILSGKDEASARPYLQNDVRVVYDREPPVISVTIDGTNQEPVGTRTVTRFQTLRVRITDNVGLAGGKPARFVSWTRSDPGAPDVVLECLAPASRGSDEAPTELSFLIGPPPGAPVATLYDFKIEAKDQSGRPASKAFAIQVATPEVAILSVAGVTSLAQFGESPARPLALGSEAVRLLVRPPRDPSLSCTLVVQNHPAGGPAIPRSFQLPSDPEGAPLEFAVSLSRPGGAPRIEHGRLVFLLQEAPAAKPDEIASVYYLLDRDPPTWTVYRGLRALDGSEKIKVGDLTDLTIVAKDGRGSGFGSQAIVDPNGVVGKHEQPSPDVLTIWLKDDTAFQGPVEFGIRDAAGNSTEVKLELERAKGGLEIRQLLTAEGKEPIVRDKMMVLERPRLRVVVDDDAAGYDAVRWIVRRADTVIAEDVIDLRPGQPRPPETIEWSVGEHAEAYRLEFYAQGPRGLEAKPFYSVLVVVDTTAPNIYLRGRDGPISKGERVWLEDLEGLRVDVRDTYAGFDPAGIAVEAVSAAGERVPASVQPDGEGRLRILTAAPLRPGDWIVAVTASDRLGNRDTRRLDVLILDPARAATQPSGPASRTSTRPGRGGERTIASDALREKDEERTGIKFRRVWATPDQSGPPRFFMSQTEVTNEQFLRFVEVLRKDPGEPIPRDLRSLSDLTPIKKKVEEMAFRFADFRRDPALPVVDVDPEVAMAYAAWTGGRLPTKSEWVGAAGKYLLSDAAYPVYVDHGVAKSGEYWMRDPDFAVFQRIGPREVRRQPVTELLRSQANAPFGIVGLAGNVAEWVTAEPGRRAIGTMGGSFQYAYTNEAGGPRLDREPRLWAADAGIRVVWPAQVKAP